ncbi:MAG: hypothetical protein JNL70_18700 [Saprospiraceae bacterium]|nr:hypothetical protein [Saprospiraceae bacterium]
MIYQNKPKLAEAQRIRSVLHHHEWLEKETTEPLDLTHLSNRPPLSKSSWLSELADDERQKLYDRLADLELIFWSLGDEEIDKALTDKNTQLINENFDRVIESRRINKLMEKIAA